MKLRAMGAALVNRSMLALVGLLLALGYIAVQEPLAAFVDKYWPTLKTSIPWWFQHPGGIGALMLFSVCAAILIFALIDASHPKPRIIPWGSEPVYMDVRKFQSFVSGQYVTTSSPPVTMSDESVVGQPLPFIHVRFINDPYNPIQETETVANAEITFFLQGGRTVVLDARWEDSAEPHVYHGPSSELLHMKFRPGAKHSIDVAFKQQREDTCWGFNNDSYSHAPSLKVPSYELGEGRIRTQIRLRGIGVDETYEFTFLNRGKLNGFEIVCPIHKPKAWEVITRLVWDLYA